MKSKEVKRQEALERRTRDLKEWENDPLRKNPEFQDQIEKKITVCNRDIDNLTKKLHG
jgi:biotin carboxylase